MITLFALLSVLVASQPPSAAPSGAWAGTMVRGGDSLRVRFDFSPGSPERATFSAPDLGAIGIPLQRVVFAHSNVHGELVGDATTTVFDGTLRGDMIDGTFSENGRAGTFSLQRLDDDTAYPYQKRDVTFRNGDVVLAGTLYMPRAAVLHPAIVFVHGSGAEGRWASAYLADYVARRGIVALIYDKRGVGESGGNWRASTVADLAADARAGIGLLTQTPSVDRRCIGIYGHSQGGQIAPEIAATAAAVKFVIDADGNVGPQYLQDLYRTDTYLQMHYSGSQLAAAQRLYREFVDVARSGSPHEKLRSDMRAAGNAPWLDDLAIPGDESWIWNWYARNGDYDNSAAWAGVRVPVSILFGGKDDVVPVQSSISQTVAILKRNGNSNVTVRVFDGADHTLHVPPASPDGWPHLPDGFPDAIPAFVSSLCNGK